MTKYNSLKSLINLAYHLRNNVYPFLNALIVPIMDLIYLLFVHYVHQLKLLKASLLNMTNVES